MEPSTTALNNTTVVFLVWKLGVGMADGGGNRYDWLKCDCGVKWISGEAIVQTCTTEGSVGDVVKRVSCARIKTWPGKHKVQREEFR